MKALPTKHLVRPSKGFREGRRFRRPWDAPQKLDCPDVVRRRRRGAPQELDRSTQLRVAPPAPQRRAARIDLTGGPDGGWRGGEPSRPAMRR